MPFLLTDHHGGPRGSEGRARDHQVLPSGSAVDMGSHNKVCAPSDKVYVACVIEE